MSRLMQFYAERFPVVPPTPPPFSELAAHAVRDIESGVCDLVIAANEATSRAELTELQTVVEALQLQIEAVVSVTKDLSARKFPRFAGQEAQ